MDPIDLFIGCEGLLGVVTEVEIGLVDRIEKTLSVIAYFGSRDGAFDFVDCGVTGRGTFDFLSLEYFDRRALDFLRAKYPDIPRGAAGAVLFELPYDKLEEHNPYPGNSLVTRLRAVLDEHRCVAHWAIPGSRREDMRLFRHALPEAVNEYVRQRAGKIGSDMAVPHARFREMMDVYEREAEASGIPFVMFGHIGDDHVHLNFLPENAEEAGRAKLAYTRLARAAVAFGGTISAEHGVGKKTIIDERGRSVPYLMALYGERGLEAIARVKRALDPKCILNVGNMVPAEMLG
jgi:D-lactate dehydrogenase (cytochrome)